MYLNSVLQIKPSIKKKKLFPISRYSMEKMKPQFGYNLQHTNIDPDICLSNMPSQILVNIAFMLSKKIVTEFNL